MIYYENCMERSKQMEIWINKNKIQEEKNNKYKNAYEFSIKRNEYSTMYTHIDYVWRQFGMKN